jgi:hypothetical protein
MRHLAVQLDELGIIDIDPDPLPRAERMLARGVARLAPAAAAA